MSAIQTNTLSAYRSSDECECRTCPECDREGETTSYVPGGYFTMRGLQREYQLTETCSTCHGTGKDTGDCAIHDRNDLEADAPRRAFDARWGITAAQLGIDGDEVCEPCAHGDHETPRISPCSCACHGERRAA